MRVVNLENLKSFTNKNEIIELLNNKTSIIETAFYSINGYKDLKVFIREILPNIDKRLLIHGKGVMRSHDDITGIIADSNIGKVSLGIRKTSKTIAMEFRGNGFVDEVRKGHAVYYPSHYFNIDHAHFHIKSTPTEIILKLDRDSSNFIIYPKGSHRKRLEKNRRLLNKD